MEEKSLNFVLYYKKQDKMKKRAIRDAFLEKASLTYPSWYQKLAKKRFSKLEMDALEDICGTSFCS